MRSVMLSNALVFIALIICGCQPPKVSPSSTETVIIPEAERSVPSPTQPVSQVNWTPQPQTADLVYYAADQGECYHTTMSCRGLNNARQVLSSSRTEAAGRGLRPCKICRP